MLAQALVRLHGETERLRRAHLLQRSLSNLQAQQVRSRAPNSVCSVFSAGASMQHFADQSVMQSNPCWMVCLISLRSAFVHNDEVVRKEPCCSPGMQLSCLLSESTVTMNSSGPSTEA
ncbi:hypothetical protein ERJ75_001550300 [Trypanosoma vivax]|nr:hypothetical protein ERJ75_001550300 [Trypanosoma vivax]